MKIGVLGGTFDPIHNGHVMMAQRAMEELGLDRVIIVPAGMPMSKRGRKVTPAEQRLDMAEIAIRGNPGLEVSRIEIERPGPSYTVDTFAELRKSVNENDRFYFILGMDSLEQFKDWYRPEALLELCRLVVIKRPGYPGPDMEALEAAIPGISRKTDIIEGMEADISATDIRKKIKNGESIKDLVPSGVAEYINEHGLYGGKKE